ncbi:hypothetical protein [Azospirillum argentinense]|uniref:hypothetical protein n=1 Tax=Azospirillum argentinense TaxID=2970906 RepID=UPI0032E03C38
MCDKPATMRPLAAIAFMSSSAPSDLPVSAFPTVVSVVRIADGTSRTWHIRPEEDWLLLRRWNEMRERGHGEDLPELLASGLPADIVALNLLEIADAVDLVAEEESSAAEWLALLARAADVPAVPVHSALLLLQRIAGTGGTVTAAVRAAETIRGDGALADARRLAETFRILSRVSGHTF